MDGEAFSFFPLAHTPLCLKTAASFFFFLKWMYNLQIIKCTYFEQLTNKKLFFSRKEKHKYEVYSVKSCDNGMLPCKQHSS